ncbi:polysaccharide pyruvyl transferase family protein [Thalassotalea agariperforans]
MLIEIKGVQFVNKGAELMLHAILQKAGSIWPDAEFCLAPNAMSPYHKRAEVGAYQRLSLKKNVIDLNGLFYFIPTSLRNRIKVKWGIVMEPDVDIVLDASGFTYGDQWSTLILKQTAIEAKRLQRKNKHYVFMPQALGPFSSKENQLAAKNAFEAAAIVFAREEESFLYAKSCTENANIIQAPDFTNLVSTTLDKKYNHLSGKIAIIPNSKMLSSKNKNELWRTNYINIIHQTILAFVEQGEEVFLLNHEGKSDENICQQINSLLSSPLEVVAPESPLDVKAIIGHAKTVVCSRYHGCVSALSQGVPCIATSWSHKYEKLFNEYNVGEFLLSADIATAAINELVASVIENQQDIKQTLAPKITEFKASSEVMWQKLALSVNSK